MLLAFGYLGQTANKARSNCEVWMEAQLCIRGRRDTMNKVGLNEEIVTEMFFRKVRSTRFTGKRRPSKEGTI